MNAVVSDHPGQEGQDDQQGDVQKNGNPQQSKRKAIRDCLHLFCSNS